MHYTPVLQCWEQVLEGFFGPFRPAASAESVAQDSVRHTISKNRVKGVQGDSAGQESCFLCKPGDPCLSPSSHIRWMEKTSLESLFLHLYMGTKAHLSILIH